MQYYVSSTGSNAANGTSLATAWQTIAFAMGATSPVVGGDSIWVRSGTAYTQYVTVGRPGASGNPITIETYPPDMPVKAKITTGGALGGIYNAISSNWIVKNLEISGTTGGAGIFFDDAPGMAANAAWVIDGCHIFGNLSGDNASGIFIQRQRGSITIQNCVLHDNLIDPPNATSGYNATGVVVFGFINPGSPGACTVRFLHNEVYAQAVGFKIKHLFATDNIFTLEVAYNFFHGITGRADIEVAGTDATHFNAGNSKRVHHNLCINHPTGTALKSAADFGDYDTEWDHNTTYNVESGFTAHREDASNESHRNNVHDNIWVPRALAAPPVGYGVSLETIVAPLNTFDYNSFWNVNPTTTVATISGVGNQNFAGWQASTNLPDAHGARVDPLFVSVGTGGATGDFHLQAGSTLRNTGSNGNDKGCYELRTEVMGPVVGGPDVTAPVLTSSYPPPGALIIPNTNPMTILAATDEAATVKYSTTPGQAYAAMPSTFATTGGTSHSTTVATVNGQSYTYYLKAQDVAGNPTTSDLVVTFTMDDFPVLSNGLPVGTRPYGTTSATLAVLSNEPCTVKYGTTPGQAYAAMPNTFTTTGGTTHTTLVTGLTNGSTYTYYLRAMDANGNGTQSETVISFSVAATASASVKSNDLTTMLAPWLDTLRKNNGGGDLTTLWLRQIPTVRSTTGVPGQRDLNTAHWIFLKGLP